MVFRAYSGEILGLHDTCAPGGPAPGTRGRPQDSPGLGDMLGNLPGFDLGSLGDSLSYRSCASFILPLDHGIGCVASAYFRVFDRAQRFRSVPQGPVGEKV